MGGHLEKRIGAHDSFARILRRVVFEKQARSTERTNRGFHWIDDHPRTRYHHIHGATKPNDPGFNI